MNIEEAKKTIGDILWNTQINQFKAEVIIEILNGPANEGISVARAMKTLREAEEDDLGFRNKIVNKIKHILIQEGSDVPTRCIYAIVAELFVVGPAPWEL